MVPFSMEVDVVGPRGPRAAARSRHAAYRLAPTPNRRRGTASPSPSSPSSARTAMSFQNKSDGPIPLHVDVLSTQLLKYWATHLLVKKLL